MFLEKLVSGIDSTIHALHNPTALTAADGLLMFKIIKEPHHDILISLWKAIKGLHDFIIGVVYIANLLLRR